MYKWYLNRLTYFNSSKETKVGHRAVCSEPDGRNVGGTQIRRWTTNVFPAQTDQHGTGYSFP